MVSAGTIGPIPRVSHGGRAPASSVNGCVRRVRAMAAGCAWCRRMEVVGCCAWDLPDMVVSIVMGVPSKWMVYDGK